MNKKNGKIVNISDHDSQFQYLGRWIDKSQFRAFVYNEKNQESLANSYEEFVDLISSGLWYETKELASKDRKQKNDIVRSNS